MVNATHTFHPTHTVHRSGAPRTAAGLVAALLLAVSTLGGWSRARAVPQRGLTAGPLSAAITVDGADLTSTITGMAQDLMAPGVVVLLRSPRGNLELAVGTRDLDGSIPVTIDDHVRIGSNTKTFTGTVILQLAQEGAVDLEAPVANYWPGVPNGTRITIAHLLTMRSGLFNYSETVELNRSLDEDPGRIWAPNELLQMGLERKPYFPPGEGYHYSNTNTILLGLIAEKIEGKPLPEIIHERLLKPLGLADISFPPSDTAAIPDPHPQGYMYGSNVETMDSAKLPAAQQAAAAAGELRPNDVTDANPSWTWAAGQMIATANDLARWVKALGDGSLLSPDWQQKRLDSVKPTNASLPSGAEYGLGVAKLGPMYGHTGELPGFNSFMGHDPHLDVTLIVWSNLGSAPNGDAVATTIARAILDEIYPATESASP